MTNSHNIKSDVNDLNVLFERFIKDDLEVSNYSFIDRDRYSKEWLNFILALSHSSLGIYEISKLLNKKLHIKEDKRLFLFYNDSFISRLKRFLFTENPRDSIEDQEYINFEELTDILNYLIKSSNIDENKVATYLYYFHYKKFLFYDFIAHNQNPEGFFPKFKENRNVRIKFTKHLEEIIDKLEENKSDKFYEKAYHLYLRVKDLPRKNLIDNIYENFNIDLNSDFLIDEKDKDEDLFLKIEKDLSQKNKNLYKYIFDNREKFIDNFYLDGMTRFYSLTLRKIFKIIKEANKYIYEKDNDDFIQKLMSSFIMYLENLKKLLNRDITTTDEKFNLLSEFLENDRKFIAEVIIKNLLPYPSKYKCENLKISYKMNRKYEICNKDKLEEIASKFYDMEGIGDLRGPWKFERFLHNSDANELSIIFSLISQSFSNKKFDLYVGILKAGVLMAHIKNIVKGENTPVFMFKSFPYIALLPTSCQIKNYKSIQFFDESFKSGFTYFLADKYLLNGYNFEKFLFTMVERIDYKSAIKPNKFDYLYKFNINQNTKEIDNLVINNYTKEIEYLSSSSFESYFNSLPDLDESLKEEIQNLITYGINTKRVDNNRLLSNTHLLFTLVKYFMKNISNNIGDRKEINLIAGSDSSYVIAYAMVIYSKFIFPEYTVKVSRKLEENQINKDKYLNVFVDIELFTSTTCKERCRECELILTISINCKLIKQIKELNKKLIHIQEINKVNNERDN